MDIKYNNKIVEKNITKKWREKKFFSNHNDKNKKTFSVILPPPNVTGKLHLGHALDSYIQDTIIRYKKINNFDVLFVPGMDHAGIATQAKVEQKLLESGINKHDLGRKKFIEKAYEWKNDYANFIYKQWDKLGLALDFTNERFTLDKDSNDAVNKVFVKLYNDGLIYKGVKAINWDPKLETALSNIEIISKPTKSKMYYIKYFFENKKDYIVVATTRIETIFSDVAIGINPNDKNKIKYLGKYVINPLNEKKIQIISDDYIDPNFGTGFMKISAHALADIDIINKNNLEIIECINQKGIMNSNALFFSGLTREQARIKIFNFLEKNNYVEKVEEITNNVSYSERSNEPIEILVMPQWFVKMKKLSKLVLDNLKTNKKIHIFPKRFEKTLKKWMDDAYDWTISRQLWWGHQIPAWYKGDEVKVQVCSPGKNWKRDDDVLDTWFSSGLVPFSFLGWPNNEKKYERFFPTSLLVTGYDIIFFWVARMYFFTLYFKKNIPFKDLLIHGLVRDEKGRKMSKSLGNGIDPMDIIEKYGSDSLRWYLLINTTPGQDINFSLEKLESSWSMCNKIWNAARFIIYSKNTTDDINDYDKWIINKLIKLKNIIDKKIEKYEFTIIGKEINEFIYNDFSSWYIEFLKININKKICLKILKNLLIILHPFFPFLTDYLFSYIFKKELLENNFDLETLGKEKSINKVIDIVTTLREARNHYNISNKKIIKYEIKNKIKKNSILLVNKIANAQYFKNNGALFTKNNLSINIYLDLETKSQEKKKTLIKIEELKNEIKRSETILNNKKFLEKAPKDKINAEKEKYKNYKKQYQELLEKIKEY